MNINLSELTLENLGSWPYEVKAGLIVALCVLLLSLGFWFDTQEQLIVLDRAEQREAQLRTEFETKQNEASNLQAYRMQLREMKKSFGVMLRQLPLSTEVPGLLEDISKTGVATGLVFKLFKPLPEKQQEFYAELPIEISVMGTYHQLAQFVAKIAALDRIVTVNDFSITQEGVSGAAGQRSPAQQKAGTEGRLVMDITAMTYRYVEERQQPSKAIRKKAKAKSGA